jgi:hypothetical protein
LNTDDLKGLKKDRPDGIIEIGEGGFKKQKKNAKH